MSSNRVAVAMAGAIAGIGAVAVGFSLLGGPAGEVFAYGPAPTPTATVTPVPTSTPTPTPTPTRTPTPTPTPSPVPNGIANPPNPPAPQAFLFSDFVVVSQRVADAAEPRIFVNRATVKRKGSPRADRWVDGEWVPVYSVGEVVRLVARVAANTEYRVQMKPKRGSYRDLGTVRSTSDGLMSLPAFRASRATTYVVSMTATTTGTRLYVRVSMGPRR